MSAPGPNSEVGLLERHVGYAPNSRHVRTTATCPGWATSGCERSQRGSPYSITSLASASSLSGTVRPSAFAVLRLITNSTVVAR
jgi:hypothetical protein